MNALHLFLILLCSATPLVAAELPVYWQGAEEQWPRFVRYWQQGSEQTLMRVAQPSEARLAIWPHCAMQPHATESSAKTTQTLHVYQRCSRYALTAEAPTKTGHALLWLEPAPAQMLAALGTQFPELQTLGLLIGPNSSATFRRWQQALPPGSPSLQPLLIRTGEQPARVFPLLLPRVSSIMLLQQPVLNDGVAAILLEQAMRQGKPVVTDNPQWLQLGAAISVSITEEIRLQETARAAQRLLRQPQSFDVDLPVHIEFNYQTLRSLATTATTSQEAMHGH